MLPSSAELLRRPYKQHYTRDWRAYRYGSKPKPTPAPLFKGKRRESAIDGVMATLETFRFSKFEREGDCRNGIRAMLCLRGHSWDVADATAADLITEALRRMGAVRPDWTEGQWSYTVAHEQCIRCGGPIDDEDMARGFRFCSPMCAQSQRQHLAREVAWDNPLRQAAYWQTYLAGAPTLTCQQCGKAFKSRSWKHDDPKFCSRTCKGLASRSAPRSCKWCGTEFQPIKGRGKFCTPNCASLFNIKEFRDTAPERNCTVCGTLFRPGSQNSAFCSKTCKMIVVNAKRRKAKKVENAVPRPAQPCIECGQPFVASRADTQYCGRRCQQNAWQKNKRAEKRAASGFYCEAAE